MTLAELMYAFLSLYDDCIDTFVVVLFSFPNYSTPTKCTVPPIVAIGAGVGIALLAGFLVYKYYLRR